MSSLHSRGRRRLIQASLGSAALVGLSRKSLAADDKILIGYWPIAAGLPLHVGLEHGIFKEVGLQVEGAKFASAQQVADPDFVRVKAHTLAVFRREMKG